jgi:L-amino acid N-acyltransferase YncA
MAEATQDLRIRPSREDDIVQIARIYGHHVLNGLASFEEVAPEPGEMARRRADILARGFPYLVAARGDEVLGYAYCSLYRPRSGYRHSLEDPIYVAPGLERGGIGSKLLAPLIDQATALGARQMIAVIGDSVNEGSIRLHARFGFRMIGTIEAVGFKHGRWVDSVLMQRALAEGAGTLPERRAEGA